MTLHKDIAVGIDSSHPPGYVQSSDPGAVGAYRVWVDTSGGTGAWVTKVRNADDSGWETISGLGGGGSTLSYLGYNTVGGSNEVMTANRVYLKKITVASNGVLLNVAAHVKNDTTDHVQQFSVAVFSDSGGSPLRVLAMNVNPSASVLLESVSVTPVYRWLACPVNLDVVAGDYWIAVQMNHASNPGSIAYDGSGSDKYYTPGGTWFADAGGASFSALTTSSNKYSIRAAFLPTA